MYSSVFSSRLSKVGFLACSNSNTASQFLSIQAFRNAIYSDFASFSASLAASAAHLASFSALNLAAAACCLSSCIRACSACSIALSAAAFCLALAFSCSCRSSASLASFIFFSLRFWAHTISSWLNSFVVLSSCEIFARAPFSCNFVFSKSVSFSVKARFFAVNSSFSQPLRVP